MLSVRTHEDSTLAGADLWRTGWRHPEFEGLTLDETLNAGGTWTVRYAPGGELARWFLADGAPRHRGIHIQHERAAGWALSGVMLEASDSQASGVTETALLATRKAQPTPSATATGTQVLEAVYTGAPTSAIKTMIDLNAGPSAPVSRRLFDAVSIETAGGETPMTLRCRMSSLLEQVADRAERNEVMVRVYSADGELRCLVRQCRDFTGTGPDAVVFAGGESGVSTTVSASLMTAGWVGGDGDGASRTWHAFGSATGRDRVETMVDGASADAASLAAETLAQGVESSQVDIDLLVADGSKEFGVDYDLGDLVRVFSGGAARSCRLRSLSIDIARDGAPVVRLEGGPRLEPYRQLIADQDELLARVRKLEAR